MEGMKWEVAMPRWNRLGPFSSSLFSITLGAITLVLGGCGGHCSGIVPCVIVEIQISPTNPSVALGSTQQFKVSGDYLDGFVADVSSNVTWSSSDTTIATISPVGLATALKTGSTTITATSKGTQRLTDSTTLTVTPPPTLVSVVLTPANPSVQAGNTAQFKATGTFSDGSTTDITSSATWSSSDTTLATISGSGLAMAAAIGRPRVTATSGSVSASTTLIVVTSATSAVTPRFAYVTNLGDDTLSKYTVNAATGQLRGNGYIQTGSHPNSLCLDPSGKFAYVTNNIANDVSAFVVDSISGSLTPVSGSPFATGSSPFTVIVEPSGTFAYVTNNQPPFNISAYAIDRNTGALSAVPGSPFATGASPAFVAVDPQGKFAYVTSFSSGTIWAYSIDAGSGALAPISGSPFAAGTEPETITLDPTGHFAYTINQNSNTVSAFSVDPSTGALAPLGGSPFPTGASPFHFTLDPSGKFAFVANGVSNNVSAYMVNATTGALAEVAGSPYAAGMEPAWLTVDPSGKFLYVSAELSNDVTTYGIDGTSGVLTNLRTVRARPGARAIAVSRGSAAVTYTPTFAYVANQNSNNVSMYAINATTGALTSTGAVAAGTQPVSVAVAPSGRLAYVANLCGSVSCSGNGNVSAYTIDGSTGALNTVPGSAFAAGSSPRSVAVDPSGRFAYVANSGSSDVSAYTIDSTTGALTSVAGSPFTAGTTPFSVTVDPSGRFAYVANLGSGSVSGNVSAYTIDRSTGALSPVPGSPFVAGSFPSSVAVDSSGEFAYVVNECGNIFCSLIGSVSAYTIDSSTGALSPIAASPFATGMSPRSVAVHPSSRFAYVANGSSSDVSAYTGDSSTGALTPVPASPFAAGAGPRSAAVDPSGKFAYVANQCGDFACTVNGNVSAYTIDSSTGALTPISASPFAAGAFALSVAIAGTIQ